jgi:hypothetical protein
MQQFMKQEFEDLEELKTAINDYNRLKVTITRKNGRIRTF